jgi:hypothetical protein
MGMNDKGTKPKLIIGIIIGVILLFVVVIFVLGTKGMVKIIGTVAGLAVIVLTIGFFAYLFWFLFLRKERFDVTYVNKKKLIEACKVNGKGQLLGDCYLSGDEGHSRVRLGKIAGGVVRTQILKRTNIYDDKGNIVMNPETQPGEPAEPKYNLESEEQDVICVKKGMGIFSDPMVIRLSPKDHSSNIGDITIRGFNILPYSEYWFVNHDVLDVRKIDFAILKEAQRGIMFENLRDMKTIVDRSIGLDSGHVKEIEKKNLVEAPDSMMMSKG